MNITDFAFQVGQVMGGITTPEIQQYLLERGINEKQIEEFKFHLSNIAQSFYIGVDEARKQDGGFVQVRKVEK